MRWTSFDHNGELKKLNLILPYVILIEDQTHLGLGKMHARRNFLDCCRKCVKQKPMHETQECWCTHTFMIGGQKRRSGVRRRRAITHWRWRSDCGKGTRAEAGRPSWGPPLGFCSFPFRSLRSLWCSPWHCPRGRSSICPYNLGLLLMYQKHVLGFLVDMIGSWRLWPKESTSSF